MKKRSFRVRNLIDAIGTHILLIAVCLVFFFPVLWLVMASFSQSGSIYDIEGFFPDSYSLASYTRLFTDTTMYDYPNWLKNTLLLFVTLLTPNYQKILQIKRRYSIIHSDTKYLRLFYPVPSYVIIAKLLTTKEAGTSPTKVWFPAPLNIDLSMYQQNHDNLICRRKQSHDSNFL